MNIAEKRKALGLKQDDLAKLLNVDRSTVAKWETRVAAPRSFMLIRLAKILQCPAEELFDDIAPMETDSRRD